MESSQQGGPPVAAPDPPSDGQQQAPDLDLRGVTKEFTTKHGTTLALSDINLSVGRTEFVSLLGRSGCGKTTLLRVLAGLTPPSGGEMSTGGAPSRLGAGRDTDMRDSCGLVFQSPNLFPWYSIQDNIVLPLKLRGVRKRQRVEKARELCELVGLRGFEKSYPRELSGGMQQRAAIARSLSYNPQILLMDEPFGALDAMTRDRMNLELQTISRASGSTVVFVTHSITEAAFLSDRVVLLSPRPGRIRSITSIPFARPRDLDLQSEPDFQDIVRDLRHQLDEED